MNTCPAQCVVCGATSFAWVEEDVWDCERCRARYRQVGNLWFLAQRYQLDADKGVVDTWAEVPGRCP